MSDFFSRLPRDLFLYFLQVLSDIDCKCLFLFRCSFKLAHSIDISKVLKYQSNPTFYVDRFFKTIKKHFNVQIIIDEYIGTIKHPSLQNVYVKHIKIKYLHNSCLSSYQILALIDIQHGFIFHGYSNIPLICIKYEEKELINCFDIERNPIHETSPLIIKKGFITSPECINEFKRSYKIQ